MVITKIICDLCNCVCDKVNLVSINNEDYDLCTSCNKKISEYIRLIKITSEEELPF